MAAIRSAQARAHRGAVRTRLTAVADRACCWPGAPWAPSSPSAADTVISGSVADQAALHGLLTKVRDLGLFLISVRHLDPD